MPRRGHGDSLKLNDIRSAERARAVRNPAAPAAGPGSMLSGLQPFDYLFPNLQGNANALLPTGPQTVAGLNALGEAMADPGGIRDLPAGQTDDGNSSIPAIYTYFGQFVDHDITLETTNADITRPDLEPLAREDVPLTTFNNRTSALDLDSVYGLGPGDTSPDAVPYNGNRLEIGTVSPMPPPFDTGAVPFKRPARAVGDDHNDLPRQGRSSDVTLDRAARLGDDRNDENTIISQLHLAFLRAHNRLIDEGRSFAQARKALRQHYQHIVVHDYMKRIADPAIVDGILQRGPKVYKPNRDRFMPVEFSFAAFRFGHSMVRNEYDFNLNFNLSNAPDTTPASLALLFTFTALSGQIGDPAQGIPEFDTLPENWIVEWERLIDGAQPGGMARKLDTRLARPSLYELRDVTGAPLMGDIMRQLARRNLLRGYLFRVPTGQAVAQALGVPKLSETELQAAVSPGEAQVLQDVGFLNRTPLWYYVLAEAAAKGSGQRLGPVGSTIVAEVLIALVERSQDSILKGGPKFTPTLPSAQPNTFILADLLRYAGVLQ